MSDVALPADYKSRWRVVRRRIGKETTTVVLRPAWRDDADFATFAPVTVYVARECGRTRLAVSVHPPRQISRLFSCIEDALAYYEANDPPPTPAD